LRIKPRRHREPRSQASGAPRNRFGPIALAITALLAVAPLGVSLLPGASRAAAAGGSADETPTPSPAPATIALQVAGGYKTNVVTDFGTAVSVPNGTYVTFRVILQPAVASASVEFWQQTGETGDWTFLSTGRTDASGLITWSKVVRVPAEATESDRIVSFKVAVSGTADYGATSSDVVRVVASDTAAPFLIVAPGTVWEDGVATWYCLPGVSPCTNGYSAEGMYAAISRGYGLPGGSVVNVCRQDRCVTVTAIDTCAAGPRCVDLYAAAFTLLAPLSTGRIAVTVQLLDPEGQATPAPEEPSPPPVTVDLQIAGGHRTSPTTGFGAAVSVPTGTYVTFGVTLQPAAADVPVEFHQRVGKKGNWTFLSTGRTDASGAVIWSRLLRVPAEATGYDRYVYFRVSVPGTPGSIAVWSNAVRGVAK
jgi:hypothetical protein